MREERECARERETETREGKMVMRVLREEEEEEGIERHERRESMSFFGIIIIYWVVVVLPNALGSCSATQCIG